MSSKLNATGGGGVVNFHRGESIHSGHFMVSQFEAEAQEDDDEEIVMPDPDEPTNVLSSVSTEMQRFGSSSSSSSLLSSSSSLLPSSSLSLALSLSSTKNNDVAAHCTTSATPQHLGIETSLAKLFKCMKLAYRQKLTSPKWNRFKGIRLRWKDKIRLNNVIWRCWHMQFIMKQKTLVCQFASPLDVDIHNKPEAVVLEGKYWKRKHDVISAEYKKWRRFYRPKALESHAISDTLSEFDLLEWSPSSSDKNLMISDDYAWSSDTLFSSISHPFAFPDPREIARGAGIADFIQPSLGPLQPNLDDFMDTLEPIQELLNCPRLPPVPEEGSDDLFKNVDYSFPMIGAEQMDSSSIADDRNLPLRDHTMQMYNQNVNAAVMPSNNQQQLLQQQSQIYTSNRDTMVQLLSNTGHNKNAYLKGKMNRPGIRNLGREPHNYDKSQPTPHQTNIYNQIMAQNQQPMEPSHNQQYQQYPNMHASPIQTTTNNFNFPHLTGTETMGLKVSDPQKSTIQNVQILPQLLSIQPQDQHIMQNVQNLIPMLTISASSPSSPLANSISHESSQASVGYKPYHSPQQSFHKQSYRSNLCSSSSSATSTIGLSNVVSQQQQQQQQHQQQQQQQQQLPPLQLQQRQLPPHPTKEMYRSNSLPINTSLLQFPTCKVEDTFAIPKYQAKNRLRSRSNSMVMKYQQQHTIQPLQAAASEPNVSQSALLTQLLMSGNNTINSTYKSQSPSTSAVGNVQDSPTPQLFHASSAPSVHMLPSPRGQISQVATSSAVSPTVGTPNFTATSPPLLSPDLKYDQSDVQSPSRVSTSATKYPRENQRRVGHIHAEQKRRCNIKNGFDMLHSLIPQLQQNPNAKLSKAAMLQKGAEYIKQLRNERTAINDKMDELRKERDSLNNSLNVLHSTLPANGAPVSRQRTGRVKELYNQYVRFRTLENWKFWIFGLIFEPLLNTFNSTVSVANLEELCRTAMLWVDQHCSLVELRPAVSNKLRYLSTTTDILSDPPSTLQEEVSKAISGVACAPALQNQQQIQSSHQSPNT